MKNRKLNPKQIEEAERLKSVWDKNKRNLGITQESAGVIMGMTQGAIGQYLNGYIALNVEAKLKFSKVLNKNPEEIWPNFDLLESLFTTNHELTIIAFQALHRERELSYQTACTVAELKNISPPDRKSFGIEEVNSELRKLGAIAN